MSKMKVAYLTGEFPRLTDTWIQREVISLRTLGVDISTFSIRKPNEDLLGSTQRDFFNETRYILDEAKSFKSFLDHFEFIFSKPKRYFESLFLALKSKRPGIKGFVYQMAYFVEAVKLAKILSSNNFDHIHNHFGDSSCTVAMLTSSLTGIDFSFTLHGPGIFFQPYTQRLDLKIAKSKFCVCISYFCRSQAAIFSNYDDLHKLKIVHCGVEKKESFSVDLPDNVLLFVGRVEEVKGLQDLIYALARLSSNRKDVKLKVVGDGSNLTRMKSLVDSLSLNDSVDFCGAQSPDQVFKAMAESTVLVLPSYAEGVPVTLMEAMGLGVPVVASNVGGVSELVDNTVNGFLVNPGDSDQLAVVIDKLLDDRNMRESLGAKAREKVNSEFMSSVEARKLFELFLKE